MKSDIVTIWTQYRNRGLTVVLSLIKNINNVVNANQGEQ